MSGNGQIKIKRREDAEAERLEASMRSLDISQIRILARKRPSEFERIYRELFVDKREVLVA